MTITEETPVETAEDVAAQVTTTELVLPAEYALRAIRAALIAASKDNARPILAAVHITVKDGTAEIVATDSYRLLLATFAAPDSPDGEILVSREMLATLAKAYTKSAVAKLGTGTVLIIRASDAGPEVTITHPTGTIVDRFGFVDGTFPNVHQLIPTTDPTGVPMIAFNPGYLGDIAKVAAEVGTDNTTPVRVETWGSYKPARFTLITGNGDQGGGITTQYLLMPVRVADYVSASERSGSNRPDDPDDSDAPTTPTERDANVDAYAAARARIAAEREAVAEVAN